MAKVIVRYATKTNAAKPCNNGSNIRVDSAHHDFSCCTRNNLTSIECDAFQEEFAREKSVILPSVLFSRKWKILTDLYIVFFILNENGFYIHFFY